MSRDPSKGNNNDNDFVLHIDTDSNSGQNGLKPHLKIDPSATLSVPSTHTHQLSPSHGTNTSPRNTKHIFGNQPSPRNNNNNNNNFVRTTSNLKPYQSTPATTMTLGEPHHDPDIDNDLVLEHDTTSSTAPRRFQFPRTQSNMSSHTIGQKNIVGFNRDFVRNDSLLSTGTDIIQFHANLGTETDSESGDTSNGLYAVVTNPKQQQQQQQNNDNNSITKKDLHPPQHKLNGDNDGGGGDDDIDINSGDDIIGRNLATVPIDENIDINTSQQQQQQSSPSSPTTTLTTDTRPAPPPPRLNRGDKTPSTTPKVAPLTLPTDDNDNDNDNIVLTTTAKNTLALDHKIPPPTPTAHGEDIDHFPDLTPRHGQLELHSSELNNTNDNDNNDNNNNQIEEFDPEDQVKPYPLTINSNDLDGLDQDDINIRLHHKYLPDWCNAFVADYLSTNIAPRRTSFQAPLDSRQIFVIVLLILSLILSVIGWFVTEPLLVARVAFGILWLILVVVSIFTWLFVSYLETQAYKLSNIPSTHEEIMKLDQRLFDEGCEQFQAIRKKAEEDDNNNNNNNTRSFSSAPIPGQHHELAGFVPIRETTHDFMTSSWFCCYRRRHLPNKYTQNNKAVQEYILQKDIPQQRVPFWNAPYSYYMKLFGDFKTTVQYLRQQQQQQQQQQQHNHLPPPNIVPNLSQGTHSNLDANQNSASNLYTFSRRLSNVSQGSRAARQQVRVNSVAPSNRQHYHENGSVFGGDMTDTQSVISTLSTSRMQQLLISPNQFNITHNIIPITIDQHTPSNNNSNNSNYDENNNNHNNTNMNNNNNNNNNPNTMSPSLNRRGKINIHDGPSVRPGTITNTSNNPNTPYYNDNNNNNNNDDNITFSVIGGNPDDMIEPSPSPSPRYTRPGDQRNLAHNQQIKRGRLKRKQSAIDPLSDLDDSSSFTDDHEINLPQDQHEHMRGHDEGDENQLSDVDRDNVGQLPELSSDDEAGRVSTIQPLMNFNFNNSKYNDDNDDDLSSNGSIGYGSRSNSNNNNNQQRAQSLTPRLKRNNYNAMNGGVSLDTNRRSIGDIATMPLGGGSHFNDDNTPHNNNNNNTHNKQQRYSTLNLNEHNNPSPQHNNSGLGERGNFLELKQRSNSGVSRQHFNFQQQQQQRASINDTATMGDTTSHLDTISHRSVTNHNVTVLRGVSEVINNDGNNKKTTSAKNPSNLSQNAQSTTQPSTKPITVADIIQTHELPIATGTYHYEDVIIDTQQQLVPIKPTSWWPHHLLSLFEIYQFTGRYFTSASKRLQYADLIDKYEYYRSQAYAGNFKYSRMSAAPEHVFVGISHDIRLNSRSGFHGSIGGEHGYYNDEVCVMKTEDLKMNYFNHFNNILSLPFHVGYFGNVSSPYDPNIETPIPIFGVGIKESRPLQETLNYHRSPAKVDGNITYRDTNPITDVQNATTIVVIGDDDNNNNNHNNNNNNNNPVDPKAPSPSFASTTSMMYSPSNADQRGRALHNDVSFSQYTYVHNQYHARGQSLQPAFTRTQPSQQQQQQYQSRPQYDSMVLSRDESNIENTNTAHSFANTRQTQPPQQPRQQQRTAVLLATESFMRNDSMPPLLKVQNDINNNNDNETNPMPLPQIIATTQPTSALTYIHPNQITSQLQTQTLKTTATTQQRLYINTKLGPMVCIDEPNHCVKHPNSRGIVVASAQCMVDFRKLPTICTDCRIIQDPTMLHCTICNKCIEGFDHHCPYLNICVGERNYHVFFTLVFTVTLFTILNCFTSIRTLLLTFDIDIFGEVTEPFENSGHYYQGNIFGSANVALLLVCIFSIIVNLIGIGAFGSLLSVHLYISAKKTTTRALLRLWKEEKEEKQREERFKQREAAEKRQRIEEKRALELKQKQEAAERLKDSQSRYHPKFKPTKHGVSLSIKFNIDQKDSETLDTYLTQPRRQTIYSRKTSGVVPLGTPVPVIDENGEEILVSPNDSGIALQTPTNPSSLSPVDTPVPKKNSIFAKQNMRRSL